MRKISFYKNSKKYSYLKISNKINLKKKLVVN